MSTAHDDAGGALMVAQEQAAATLAVVREQARDYAQLAKAPNTRRAYRADWADFTAWCRAHGRAPLPAAPETLAPYLAGSAAQLKASTTVGESARIAASRLCILAETDGEDTSAWPSNRRRPGSPAARSSWSAR